MGKRLAAIRAYGAASCPHRVAWRRGRELAIVGLPDRFIDHGERIEQLTQAELDADNLERPILTRLGWSHDYDAEGSREPRPSFPEPRNKRQVRVRPPSVAPWLDSCTEPATEFFRRGPPTSVRTGRRSIRGYAAASR